MSMYLDDLATREFVVTQEGYDRDEVRSFLEVVARNQRALQDEIAGLREQHSSGEDIGGEIAGLLQNARTLADETLRKAREEAQTIRLRAEEDAELLRQSTIDASDRAREEADLYAFETRAKADKEIREKLREANERVENLLESASKVRDRLLGLDAVMVSVRNEVAVAAESLDGTEDEIETAEVPPPPPPPAIIDLTDAGSNGSRIAADA
jgi:cell division septum initiation protein DivIVA